MHILGNRWFRSYRICCVTGSCCRTVNADSHGQLDPVARPVLLIAPHGPEESSLTWKFLATFTPEMEAMTLERFRD